VATVLAWLVRDALAVHAQGFRGSTSSRCFLPIRVLFHAADIVARTKASTQFGGVLRIRPCGFGLVVVDDNTFRQPRGWLVILYCHVSTFLDSVKMLDHPRVELSERRVIEIYFWYLSQSSIVRLDSHCTNYLA